MDSFIKKIFDGKTDNLVHLQFQKFSRGEFRNRAMINASKSNDKYSISTTYEYAGELIRMVAEKIPAGQKVRVTGVVVSTRDLKEELKFKNIKQFMGVKQYIIDDLMGKDEIVKICDKYPNSFIGLSFSFGDTELKIKSKAPKSAKPNTSEKPTKPDFCKLKTSDNSMVKSLLFDLNDFKKVEINHEFIITDIEIPKNESDPAKMRELAIRKGKIIRKITIDEKTTEKEITFEA